MPLIVGNLLTDPAANSFISLADADAYLGAEANAPWSAAAPQAKEAALINASRWLSASLVWCDTALSDADLARVGHVSARLAVEALTVDLWASEAVKDAKRYKAGSVEVEYQDTSRRGGAAGGKRFPWMFPMLRGLLCGTGVQRDVVRR
ncbi:DnaT-like ssDNA-binding protein [Paracoccus homiensis]|uniref:Putative DnaT-like domain-containing protein n=1 Tax=Paracoccus homiensis TaxID=364199 RepID=A0A1I0J2J2_9RHOB|nr:DnaT-like ssDNA-binding protein [Paracoccus homiensis]SEU03186.1 hypothetical protein SAMN04489858_12058 [Paracoccus homiensis]